MNEKILAVGLTQIVSGMLSLSVMALGWFFMGGTAGGFCSMFICTICSGGICPLPVGALCGFIGVLPLILGLIEIISGAVLLGLQEKAKTFALIVGVAEILSILYGGVISLIAGIVVVTVLPGVVPQE
ncbi:MAG: hypothetical protein HN348_10440 [Proteobacteria bacterium]|jgi:hypothetical protein|nr:hypothetical protein [Pseudomonadota bacterium]